MTGNKRPKILGYLILLPSHCVYEVLLRSRTVDIAQTYLNFNLRPYHPAYAELSQANQVFPTRRLYWVGHPSNLYLATNFNVLTLPSAIY